jgi:hypothetical protein
MLYITGFGAALIKWEIGARVKQGQRRNTGVLHCVQDDDQNYMFGDEF